MGITDQELCGNPPVLITAGSETTATTLCSVTSVTWFLLQNDNAMQKLKEEVRTRFHSEEETNVTNVAQLKSSSLLLFFLSSFFFLLYNTIRKSVENFTII
jgi:cytochrome P450